MGEKDFGCTVVLVFALSLIMGLMGYDWYYWEPEREKARLAEERKQSELKEMRAVPVANRAISAENSNSKRFVAEFYGEFNGGYQNNIRQIFVIKDNNTSAEYLAITGCGVTELRDIRVRSGKTTKTVTVEE